MHVNQAGWLEIVVEQLSGTGDFLGGVVFSESDSELQIQRQSSPNGFAMMATKRLNKFDPSEMFGFKFLRAAFKFWIEGNRIVDSVFHFDKWLGFSRYQIQSGGLDRVGG